MRDAGVFKDVRTMKTSLFENGTGSSRGPTAWEKQLSWSRRVSHVPGELQDGSSRRMGQAGHLEGGLARAL